MEGFGSWRTVTSVEYVDLKDTTMIGLDGGFRGERSVPMLGRPLLISMDVRVFVSQVDSYSVNSEQQVTDPVYPDRTTVVPTESKEDSKLFVGASTRVGTEIPILGKIPLLGRLFVGARASSMESELIIFVGASLVMPFD